MAFSRWRSWVGIAKKREVIADGWGAQGIGNAGNRIDVKWRIGFSEIPARFNCQWELTVFTLRQANSAALRRGPEGINLNDTGTPDHNNGRA